MAENLNNNNTAGNSASNMQQEIPATSTWVTVNTSTTENIARMEISKSEDFDLVIKTRQ